MTEPKYWFQPSSTPAQADGSEVASAGDRAAPDVYVFDKDQLIVRAVNVAGATGRPLLIDGPSGCGKSSLAYYIAWAMRWPLHSISITSRTQATDLMYTVDQLKRLQDAQAKELKEIENYIRPGVLWKGFDPEGAKQVTASSVPKPEATANGAKLPQPNSGAVILIDEIDKADPDVPNNLLVPLGSYRFEVPELAGVVHAQQIPFIVLTSNNERKLPPAFLRRCVHLTLPEPDEERVIAAGRAHNAAPDATITAIARLFFPGTATARREAPVSIAEYLDAVRACHALSIDPGSDHWKWVHSIIMGRDQGSRNK